MRLSVLTAIAGLGATAAACLFKQDNVKPDKAEDESLAGQGAKIGNEIISACERFYERRFCRSSSWKLDFSSGALHVMRPNFDSIYEGLRKTRERSIQEITMNPDRGRLHFLEVGRDVYCTHEGMLESMWMHFDYTKKWHEGILWSIQVFAHCEGCL